MSDLLSAASLLLTAITILYSLWYAEIISALDIKIEKHAANRNGSYQKARSVLWCKSIPLSISAVILLAVNLPDAFEIVQHAFNVLRGNEQGPYSAVRATFLAVVVVLVVLLWHIVTSTIALGRHTKKLNPASGDY